jgi:hypothetical protein
MSKRFVFGGSFTSFVFDADALAYINANSAITLDADKLAINDFFVGLKADGIYTKIKAMYLPKWGAATNDKWNLINPLDTDAAFRLVFSGGITHSSTGIIGGVNGYANTFVNPNSHLSLNTTHISFYSRHDIYKANCVEMGVNPAGGGISALFIAPKFNGANTSYRAVNSSQLGPGASPTMNGFFVASRINSTNMKLYKNNSVLFNDSQSSGALINGNIFLLCYNEVGGSGALFYSNKECAFSSIGEGLSDTEQSNLYTRVNTLMTYFGINV